MIEQLQTFVEEQASRQLVPNNYEGIRVACTEEKGWFVLRLSLHVLVPPLNIESDQAGGVSAIKQQLLSFLKTVTQLDISALEE